MAALGLKCTNINLLWQDRLPNSVVLLASRDFPRAYLFSEFLWKIRGESNVGIEGGLSPPTTPPHTKKTYFIHKWRRKREGGRRSCYASSIPNGNKLVTVSSFFGLDLRLYIGLFGSLGYFFIPPPFRSKIVQSDPKRGPFLNYLQIAHPKKAIPQGWYLAIWNGAIAARES